MATALAASMAFLGCLPPYPRNGPNEVMGAQFALIDGKPSDDVASSDQHTVKLVFAGHAAVAADGRLSQGRLSASADASTMSTPQGSSDRLSAWRAYDKVFLGAVR